MIVSNQIKCKWCGDTPYSTHRHDMKYCKCGKVAVDGGQEYLRRVFDSTKQFNDDLYPFEDMSITAPDNSIDVLLAAVDEARERHCNARGIVYAVLRAIRDEELVTQDGKEWEQEGEVATNGQ